MRQYFWERKRLYSWTGSGWHYIRVYLIEYVERNGAVTQQGYYDSKKKAKRVVAYYNRREAELCPTTV
jgi:hypothetical protein